MTIVMDIGLCVEYNDVLCDVAREVTDCPYRNEQGIDSSGLDYTIYGVNRYNF